LGHFRRYSAISLPFGSALAATWQAGGREEGGIGNLVRRNLELEDCEISKLVDWKIANQVKSSEIHQTGTRF
jgi:hypothetical protein